MFEKNSKIRKKVENTICQINVIFFWGGRRKRKAVCALHLPVTRQGSTPLSLILLSILYVFLCTLFVTSRPSCLA